MIDIKDAINTVWEALSSYRETCILEGDKDYDEEWDNICNAMAIIEEDLDSAATTDS